jgi:putative MATE family efflux protein
LCRLVGVTIAPGRDLDRRIARLAIPAIGSIAAEPLYNLADTAIVGHLGRVPLDSLAIATSALSIVAWLAVFLSTATTSAVARLTARGDDAAVGRAVGAAYLVAVGWGAVTAVAVLAVAPWVAQALGAHGAAAAGAVGYLRAAAVGLPFLYLGYVGNGHLTGLADTRTPLRIAVSANAANVAAEAIAVFGLHAGLLGSAWGTVMAQVAAAAWYARASSRRAAARPRRPGRSEVRRLLREGHQLSVRTIALGLVPLGATAIVARLGPVLLGGQQVAMRLWYLLSISLDALAVPAQVYVSAALGTGDAAGARLVGRRTLWLGLAAGGVLGAVTALLALFAPAAFTSDGAVRHAAVIGLVASALTQPLAALAFVLDGLILGIGDYVAMRRAMILAIGAFLPLALLTARWHWLGLPGVWAALGLWLAARSLLLGRRWRRHVRDTGPAGSTRAEGERTYAGPHEGSHLATPETVVVTHAAEPSNPVREPLPAARRWLASGALAEEQARAEPVLPSRAPALGTGVLAAGVHQVVVAGAAHAALAPSGGMDPQRHVIPERGDDGDEHDVRHGCPRQGVTERPGTA